MLLIKCKKEKHNFIIKWSGCHCLSLVIKHCQNGVATKHYMPLNVKQYEYRALLNEVLLPKCLTWIWNTFSSNSQFTGNIGDRKRSCTTPSGNDRQYQISNIVNRTNKRFSTELYHGGGQEGVRYTFLYLKREITTKCNAYSSLEFGIF